jgi:hypothetical protein
MITGMVVRSSSEAPVSTTALTPASTGASVSTAVVISPAETSVTWVALGGGHFAGANFGHVGGFGGGAGGGHIGGFGGGQFGGGGHFR